MVISFAVLWQHVVCVLSAVRGVRAHQVWLFHPTIISGAQETCGQHYEVRQYCVLRWDDVWEEPRG
jgi:hypothetical protein